MRVFPSIPLSSAYTSLSSSTQRDLCHTLTRGLALCTETLEEVVQSGGMGEDADGDRMRRSFANAIKMYSFLLHNLIVKAQTQAVAVGTKTVTSKGACIGHVHLPQ